MEVVDENSAVLSNYEVFSLLTDIQNGESGQKKPNKHQQSLATISYSTLKYLEKTPCVAQKPEAIAQFMQVLQSYKLTKAEKLQLLNHRPTTAVEIQLIVEESEERLTEDQIYRLLEVIARFLPPVATPGGEEGVDEPMDSTATS